MARPSLKQERRAEILDAYGRCVLRYGVEGATLARTADEAGLARALIRHNVGNKDELLAAFLERFFERSIEDSRDFVASMPDRDRIPALLDGLFNPDYTDREDVGLSTALIVAAADRPDLGEQLRTWTQDFITDLEEILKGEFPKASPAAIRAVATGVAAIHGDAQSLTLIGEMAEHHRQSEAAAAALIGTLAS
ncbi:MAG: TetR/AcrR family transcriptional regulator [Pseudomonadota bacterium]